MMKLKRSTSETHHNNFYVEEDTEGRHKILVVTRAPILSEVGDIIFSLEEVTKHYVLSSTMGRSLEYFCQNPVTFKTFGMTADEIAMHKREFMEFLSEHPNGELLRKIYRGEVNPSSYYVSLMRRH